MKKLFAFAAPLALLASGCSALTGDECGMSGDWFALRWAHNNSGHVRWMENGRPQGLSFVSDEPIKFSSDGTITGGRRDGVSLGGGITATMWSCEGEERFILKGDMLGLEKRITKLSDGLWKYSGTGKSTYYAMGDDREETTQILLDFMQERAVQEGRSFER